MTLPSKASLRLPMYNFIIFSLVLEISAQTTLSVLFFKYDCHFNIYNSGKNTYQSKLRITLH